MTDVTCDGRSSDELRWGPRKRLEFIDFRLLWNGRVNRSDICIQFKISLQQASADLASYERFAPENMRYDRGQRTFVRASSYTPLLIGGFSDRYLLQLQALRMNLLPLADTWFDDPPPAQVTSMRRKSIDDGRLQAILDAIRDKLELRVTYSTMSDKPVGERHIAPHSLACADGRWHARCWSRENGEFRDFNLNRIREIHDRSAATVDSKLDLEWHTEVDLIMQPNPALSEQMQASVRDEFAFEGENLVVTSRIALVFYLFHEYNLEHSSKGLPPAKRQLVLLNDDEVQRASISAKDIGARAIKAVMSGSSF